MLCHAIQAKPNDSISNITCQGYYLHPDIQILSAGAKIADLCTGTAIFLREVAPAYPAAEFHGFDISDKMFSQELPDNVQLHLADVKKPFDERWLEYFDVVHLRFIEAAMRKEDWAPLLKNIITLLKPGGWIQWVEDDRAHSVRHAARPVAPLGAAKQSLSVGATEQARFIPRRFENLNRFPGVLLHNALADNMTYGYMNLHLLMKDPEIGDLEQVGCDLYVVDREDDGGELRRGWVAMGAMAVWSMLQALEAAGEEKLTDMTRDELVAGFKEDIDAGGHFVVRVTVFTGRKKS